MSANCVSHLAESIFQTRYRAII
ncbi:DUF6783 domain-containing protein [Murimonas intestini]